MNGEPVDLLGLLERSGRLFRSEGFHLHVRGQRSGITRFANNEITDNQTYVDAAVTIRAYTGDRVGVATVNQLDTEAIRAGARRAEEIAAQSPIDPEYTGPPDERSFPSSGGFDEASAKSTPADRARWIAPVIQMCRERGLNAAGYIQADDETVATHSSAGSPSLHRATTVQFSMSAKTGDRTGSGWVLRWGSAFPTLDIPALARAAVEKAESSRNPAELQPGRYTVVLEPAAAEDLLYGLTGHLWARSADEGRSFVSRFDASGSLAGTRVGERIFSPLFTLDRRIGDPRIGAHPFDEDGIALNDLTIARQGTLVQLRYDSWWAKKNGVRPTGEFAGMRMEGSSDSNADLIRQVSNGILVTRLWYIRSVDPMKSSVTGMTRDGTFRIEGGEIAGPIKNLRFSEELRRVFRDFTAAGTPERFYSWLAPGIVVPDFQFTSTTESI